MELSRKQFIAGAGATMAAAGMASVANAGEAAPAWMPEQWDVECDVVVVGSGSAITAALRAADAGLDVLVIEKHPTHFGGTTALCGGGMNCPNCYLAAENGSPEVPRDLLKEYLMGVAEGQSSEELIDMYLDNCSDVVKFMNEDCGYKWEHFGVSPVTPYNYYYPYPPIEEYADIAVVVHIGTHEATGKIIGGALQEFARDAIAARDNIEVMMGTAATKLIYSGNPMLGNGEVIGVWAEQDGKPIAIKARYAVVLGTGGFDHNREMVRHHINHPIYTTCAIETNTGDGHIMAMEVGANMRNMNEVYNCSYNMAGDPDRYLSTDVSEEYLAENISGQHNPLWDLPGTVGTIMVNKHGVRFANEGSSYDLLGRAFDTYDTARREWTNIPGYVIVDSTFKSNFGFMSPTLGQLVSSDEPPAWLHAFDSIEELADGMGIDKEALVATIERFNGYCETGEDPEWNRGVSSWDRCSVGDLTRYESGELANPSLAPIAVPPFYCVEIYPGMLSTTGGMEINANAQVINVRGEVIPRLYAASSCAASPFGRGYPIGGSGIGIGLVEGYVAANHIATLEPWE